MKRFLKFLSDFGWIDYPSLGLQVCVFTGIVRSMEKAD